MHLNDILKIEKAFKEEKKLRDEMFETAKRFNSELKKASIKTFSSLLCKQMRKNGIAF